MNDDSTTFCLADYDAIGFDLDHTLAKYKLVDLMNVWQFVLEIDNVLSV